MEHPLTRNTEVKFLTKAQREYILEVMSKGVDPEDACATMCIPYSSYLITTIESSFAEGIEEAKKKRADYWYGKIMKDVDVIPSKEDAPGSKLKFEKLKWLAKIDNPEKYGDKVSTSVDITHNINLSVKNMSISDAKKILEDDPFSVPLEADYRKIEENTLSEPNRKDSPL